MEDPLQLLQALDAPEPLTLTFGVELELILRFNPADYTKESDDGWSMPEERGRDHMRAVLEELPAYNNTERFGQWVAGFEKWDLGRDSSIDIPELWEPPDGDHFGYSAIELRSPALPYTTASLSQVKEVFHLLFTTFDIVVNESCGLHVHVGNELKGFPLQTLKNFCILTTRFERELQSLHPPSRLDNRHTKSSGALFMGISPWDVEKIIKSTHNEDDLIIRVQNTEKGYAYNLLNLRGGKETIEFRQHEATVNVDDIVKWVKLTCSLVEKAHEFAMEDYHDLDQNVMRRYHVDDFLDDTYHHPNRSILDVLASLGLGELAEYYRGRGPLTHSRPAWAWVDPCQEDAMTPWIESAHLSEYMDGEEIDRSLRVEYINGEQITRSVANTKENRENYWNAVLRSASNTVIHVPCEHDSKIGVEGSWECFCDDYDWDCRSRAESRTTASARVRGRGIAQNATVSDCGSDTVQTPMTTEPSESGVGKAIQSPGGRIYSASSLSDVELYINGDVKIPYLVSFAMNK